MNAFMLMLKKIPISDEVNGNLKSEILTVENRGAWPLSNPLNTENTENGKLGIPNFAMP